MNTLITQAINSRIPHQAIMLITNSRKNQFVSLLHCSAIFRNVLLLFIGRAHLASPLRALRVSFVLCRCNDTCKAKGTVCLVMEGSQWRGFRGGGIFWFFFKLYIPALSNGQEGTLVPWNLRFKYYIACIPPVLCPPEKILRASMLSIYLCYLFDQNLIL